MRARFSGISLLRALPEAVHALLLCTRTSPHHCTPHHCFFHCTRSSRHTSPSLHRAPTLQAPAWVLSWEYRFPRIIQEIAEARPDIVCLQEANHYGACVCYVCVCAAVSG